MTSDSSNDDLNDSELARLVAGHPLLFRNSTPDVESYLMPGWYHLVDKLCRDIEAALGTDVAKFRVRQIKEKFGGLRFYYRLGKVSDPRVDLVSADSVQSLTVAAGGSTKMEQVRQLIQDAEARSAQACELCGKRGELRRNSGWITALCDEHANLAVTSKSTD